MFTKDQIELLESLPGRLTAVTDSLSARVDSLSLACFKLGQERMRMRMMERLSEIAENAETMGKSGIGIAILQAALKAAEIPIEEDIPG